MKNIFYFVLSAFLVLSCAKEPLPYETYENFKKGGFARLISTDGGSFFFTDPDNSSFNFEVEYYSEDNGSKIAAHEWFVRHRNNVTGTISEPSLLTRMEKSSFGTNAKSGLPSASFSFNLSDALAAMNLTTADVNGGDDLIFDGVIVMDDGSRYGPDNTGNSVKGGAGFDGIFRFIKPLLCASNLAGVYDAATTVKSVGAGIGWDDCDGRTWTGQVEFVSSGDGEYTLYSIDPSGVRLNDPSMGAYTACYETTDQGSMANPQEDPVDGNVELVDACNQLAYKGSSQWGEVYTFNTLVVDGDKLTIGWQNDYGEAGETVLTRTDGTNWPALKAN